MSLPLSVTQTRPFFAGSTRYAFVPTTQIIEVLAAEGWLVSKAQETAVLDPRRQGFQKHLVRFRQGTTSLVKKEAVYPEIVLINSHDGRTAPEIHAGTFRLVCTNGMVVADSLLEAQRFRHVKDVLQQLLDAVKRIAQRFPFIAERINTYREIELTQDERGVFAEAAAAVRWSDPEKLAALNVTDLLAPRRPEDAPPTLWHTFQVLQEKLITGGTTFSRRRYSHTAKAITSIDELRRVNTALWAMTEQFALLKSA
jgi:hypothetical protein